MVFVFLQTFMLLCLFLLVPLFSKSLEELLNLKKLINSNLHEFVFCILIACIIHISGYLGINSILVLGIMIYIYIVGFTLLSFYSDIICRNNLTNTSFIDKIKYFFDMKFFWYIPKQVEQLILQAIKDIKVGIFGHYDIKAFKAMMEDFYNWQKAFFKYAKPRNIEDDLRFSSHKEYIKLMKRLADLVDPKVKFNKVSRLPWKLKTDHEDSIDNFFMYSPLLSVYSFLKTTLISILLSLIYFLYTIFFFKIQFLKQLSVWFIIGMMFFWLISGFNFFLKRYQFGKFTSQIQRFWKRTNISFWLIEGFLLLLFFYYYLNSSQEPLYMYDYSSLNKEYLVSLYTIGFNVILLSIVIYFMYFTLLRLNSNSWEQLSLNLIVISVFIFFSFFIETYQFYYVISVFNERLWVFNEEDNLWSIEVDNPILRSKTQYFLVCLIAKYWHFLFIFLSWVFFLMKSFEKKKITYVLFGSSLQNIILLFVLNLACYVQWLKWIYRRFFDLPYNWFFTNVDNKFLYKFFREIELIFFNLLTINVKVTNTYSVIYKSLSLWGVESLFLWKFI